MNEPNWEFVAADRLHLPALPYAERQLIVIGPDEVVLAQRRAVVEQQDKAREASKTVAGLAGVVSAAQALGAIGAVRAAALPLASSLPTLLPGLLLTKAAIELYQAFRKAGEVGLDVLMITSAEAAALKFGPGHPRSKVVYAGHPAERTTYVPLAEFHGKLFEHKVAEVTNLLAALAATDIEIEHVSGWESVGEAGGAVTAPQGISGEAKIGRTRRQGRRLVSKMTLAPDHAPYVPKDLVWFDHEPMWQSVARARLEAGLQSFEFDIQYTDDFGVNAKISAMAEKAKFEVGGNFSRHQDTVWRLRGHFTKVGAESERGLDGGAAD